MLVPSVTWLNNGPSWWYRATRSYAVITRPGTILFHTSKSASREGLWDCIQLCWRSTLYHQGVKRQLCLALTTAPSSTAWCTLGPYPDLVGPGWVCVSLGYDFNCLGLLLHTFKRLKQSCIFLMSPPTSSLVSGLVSCRYACTNSWHLRKSRNIIYVRT